MPEPTDDANPTDSTDSPHPPDSTGPRSWWDGAAPERVRRHPASELLGAAEWVVTETRPGHLEVTVELPDAVKNPRGQLFGGFTPTYVDLIGLRAIHQSTPEVVWLATTAMSIQYFEPIVGPTFTVHADLEKSRGRTHVVVVRFFQDGVLAVHANLTARSVKPDRSLGDL